MQGDLIMSDNLRYSVDDAILDDPVIRKGIKIKGVTQFNRQENIKTLYSQKLSKEEKQLSLETFNDNGLNTFRVIMNGLEIGVLPEDCLNLFLSKKYDYELTNIHLGEMTVEYGRTIYFAKLYATFTPKKTQYKTNNTNIKQTDNNTVNAELSFTRLQLEVRQRMLNEVKEENELLKTKIAQLQSKRITKVYIPRILAIISTIAAVLIFLVFNTNTKNLERENTRLKNYNSDLSSKIEQASKLEHAHSILSIQSYTDNVSRGKYFKLKLSNNLSETFTVSLYDKSMYRVSKDKFPDSKINTIGTSSLTFDFFIPKNIDCGLYYFQIKSNKHLINLPFHVTE